MFETSWKVVYKYNVSTQDPEAERSQASYVPWLSDQKETWLPKTTNRVRNIVVIGLYYILI